MTLKKWRPFWSYDVEKTEKFLSEMAADGNQLVDVNIWTRMFSFEEGKRETTAYQVIYDKSQKPLPHYLEDTGWKTSLSEGNWQFIKNDEELIRAYPVREEILKRNRLHSNILKVIACFYGFQLIMPLTILLALMSTGEAGTFMPSPLWGITIIYFVQVVIVIWLAIHAARKLRAFERKYFSAMVDEDQPSGKIIKKWKIGWMNAPDLLEKWLSNMALDGYHLIRVKGTRFTFEKGEPKYVSYIYDYQLKVSPNYYDIHKEAGWQLKFTSPYAIFKSSLWMREYANGEEKPQLTYDSEEKKMLVRKVLFYNIGLIIYSAAIVLFVLWLNLPFLKEEGWTIWGRFIVSALSVSLIIPFTSFIRTLQYVFRMKQV